MVCIGGTCSASSFSSVCFFHLTAKIKAYNQILLIGPDCGDEPGVSPRALPLRAGNDKESRAAGAPVSHDSGHRQSTPPADSHLAVASAEGCLPNPAVSISTPPFYRSPRMDSGPLPNPASGFVLRLSSSVVVFVSNRGCSPRV